MALTAFAAITELKPVALVDDVDIFDSDDVLWAMTIRYHGDVSTVFLSSVRCHPLDPSQSPDFSPTIPRPRHLLQDIFGCTVPNRLRNHFKRAQFAKVNLARFLPPDFAAQFPGGAGRG
jgi:gallate decarboxylase subunit C